MNDYCEITLAVAEENLREFLIAGLSDIGFDGFEESDTGLKAYIPAADYAENDLINLLNKYNLAYSKSVIKKQNWNEVWESNFEPVQVEDFVGIRASFHAPFINVEHEIVITPKMSFGTGHHATTYMVMLLMKELDFKGWTVFDFGTGTGILAILAEQLGAAKVLAVDNDDWCIENASENILINGCKSIEIEKVDKFYAIQAFDIILANINRNIILDNVTEIRKALVNGSQLLLSGLLIADEAEIVQACEVLGIHHRKTIERKGWIALWLYL